MAGILYLVATPIGNLKDITERAREVLGAVSLVACEDTRHSRILLDHLGLKKETRSLPAFAEGQRAHGLLEALGRGEDVALITDAGTPAVSDPGEHLVREAVERGIQVVPVPGPSAVLAALSASGLPTGRFHFLGFLPRSSSERAQMLEEVAPLRATLVLYESPKRLRETLGDLATHLGPRRAVVARELTKVHEELVRGTLPELAERFREEPLGELVILVEGRAGEARWSEEEVRAALAEGLKRGDRLKQVANEVAKRAGWPAQQVYRLGLK